MHSNYPPKSFLDGFRYGLGLWSARLLVTVIAVPAGACLLSLAVTALDILLKWLGI